MTAIGPFKVIQGHSRSPILVPIESSYVSCCHWITLAPFPSHRSRRIGQIVAFSTGFPYLTPLFGANPWILDSEIWFLKTTRSITLLLVHNIFRYILKRLSVDHQCDRRTDRRTNRFAIAIECVSRRALKTDKFSEKTDVRHVRVSRPTNANRQASLVEQIVPPSSDWATRRSWTINAVSNRSLLQIADVAEHIGLPLRIAVDIWLLAPRSERDISCSSCRSIDDSILLIAQSAAERGGMQLTPASLSTKRYLYAAAEQIRSDVSICSSAETKHHSNASSNKTQPTVYIGN